MALSNKQILEYNKRLLLSRMRILINNGFYGLLLMHMKLALDETCETAATDGKKIYFGPKFLDKISDSELDFIMMHEILHVALQHCYRDGDRDSNQFNIACDIVVNSNILKSNNMDLKSITLREFGESMHLTPDNREGYEFTAEEVYALLPAVHKKYQDGSSNNGGVPKTSKGNGKKNSEGVVDDHTRWENKGDNDDSDDNGDLWIRRVVNAAEAISIQEATKNRGGIPMCVERILRELKESQIDWRRILADFIQEEVCDYSFSPPDKRFSETPFFLPDFNETNFKVSNILFMIDTSGSMSDEAITAAYSEIKGAIDQFDGKLEGLLGFFDAGIVEPIPFSNVDEVKRIVPAGGGGTSFHAIFKYVNEYMQDNPPSSIIILTDGYAPFPKESITNNMPVLWLLNNELVSPPWGKVARIKV